MEDQEQPRTAPDEAAELELARAECEARGFPLEHLSDTSLAGLLCEASRLEASTLQELRKECTQQHLPAAACGTCWGEHDELARVLMDLHIWNRMQTQSLRALCQARGLAVADAEPGPSPVNRLREEVWAAQGIPIASSSLGLHKAQNLLAQLGALEHSSLEELRKKCKGSDVPFSECARKEELVFLLRLQIIWREAVPLEQLERERQSQKGGGILHLIESCRKDVLEAHQLVFELRLPSAMLRRAEVELYRQLHQELSDPSPLFSRWVSLEEALAPSSGDTLRFSFSVVSRRARCWLCRPVWEACGIPVSALDLEGAADVAKRWRWLQQAPLGDLYKEYCAFHGLPAERRLDPRALRKRLRWLVLEDAQGTTWADRGEARGIAMHRLQSGHLPLLRLAQRLDALAGMSEEKLQRECQVRRLLWAAPADVGDLRERLRREALLQELSWEELQWECLSLEVPLEGLHFWGLCWFSTQQERELRTWLVHWCLVHENRALWEARGLPVLCPNAASSLLRWYGELEEMSGHELKSLYMEQGMPGDVELEKPELIEHLVLRLVSAVLPLAELKRTCLQRGAPAHMEESEDWQELDSWLLADLRTRVYSRRGIPVERLCSRGAARELYALFRRVEAIGQQGLVDRCRELGLPVVGLPQREELVERLKKVSLWHRLSRESLLAECFATGIWSSLAAGLNATRESLIDALVLHECHCDFQQWGIPMDGLASFSACVELAQEWGAVAGLAEGSLRQRMSKEFGSAFAGTSRLVAVELLREMMRLERVPLPELQKLHGACCARTPAAAGLTMLPGKGVRRAQLRGLVLVLRQSLFLDGENVPAGQPCKLELLCLLAKFQNERHGFKGDFTEAMEAWTWWDLRLFLQSEGAFNPGDPRLASMHREPAASPGAQLLVSVVVPTWEGRQHFHDQLWRCFAQQTWEEKELVVVETWTHRPSPLFTAKAREDSRLVYVAVQVQAEGMPTLGSKRNLCNQLASGTLIANFDDDDFYAPRYLETMLERMRYPKQKDAVKLSSWYVLDASTAQFGYVDPVHEDSWRYGFGFSYVYTRDIARRVAYRDTNYSQEGSEDLIFFQRIMNKSQRGVDLFPDDFGLCLHYLHEQNCASCVPDYSVLPSEAEVLEVRQLPGFNEFLSSLAASSGDLLLPPRARMQELRVWSRGAHWDIEVPAGSTAREVVRQLHKVAGDAVVGWGTLALSLREKEPPMRDDDRVPLRVHELFVWFQVLRRSDRTGVGH